MNSIESSHADEANAPELAPMDGRTKPCSKCRVEKPLGDFHRSRAHKDGREYRCRVCRSVCRSVRHKATNATPDRLATPLPGYPTTLFERVVDLLLAALRGSR